MLNTGEHLEKLQVKKSSCFHNLSAELTT